MPRSESRAVRERDRDRDRERSRSYDHAVAHHSKRQRKDDAPATATAPPAPAGPTLILGLPLGTFLMFGLVALVVVGIVVATVFAVIYLRKKAAAVEAAQQRSAQGQGEQGPKPGPGPVRKDTMLQSAVHGVLGDVSATHVQYGMQVMSDFNAMQDAGQSIARVEDYPADLPPEFRRPQRRQPAPVQRLPSPPASTTASPRPSPPRQRPPPPPAPGPAVKDQDAPTSLSKTRARQAPTPDPAEPDTVPGAGDPLPGPALGAPAPPLPNEEDEPNRVAAWVNATVPERNLAAAAEDTDRHAVDDAPPLQVDDPLLLQASMRAPSVVDSDDVDPDTVEVS